MNGISVIICCYNSEKRLPDTLKALSQQVGLESIPWEIVVVDNKSSDGTKRIASTEWQQRKKEHSPNAELKVVEELSQGLVFARNCGVANSKYSVLVFCDDDNWLQNDFLSRAFLFIDSNSKIGALGGQGSVVCDDDPPAWFEEFKDFYACSPQGTGIEKLTNEWSYLYGAGMVVRKSAWDDIHSKMAYSISTGRKGSSLSSGEDVEFCYKLRLSGWELWYNEELRFKHYMPANRLTIKYLDSLANSASASAVILSPYVYVVQGQIPGTIKWLKDIGYLSIRIFSIVFRLVARRKQRDQVDLRMRWGSLKALLAQARLYHVHGKLIKESFQVS